MTVRVLPLLSHEQIDTERTDGVPMRSIAAILEVIEGFSAFDDCHDEFENLLVTCWQTFCLLGDVTISFTDTMIVVHTLHVPDSANQMNIVLLSSAWSRPTCGVRVAGNSDKAFTLTNGAEYRKFLESLGGMRLNRARRLRVER